MTGTEQGSGRPAKKMLIGYARVSKTRQRLDLQLKALQAARCDLVIFEHRSGGGSIGRGLLAALGSCAKGDTLVVWKLDRLGRNLRELLAVLEVLVQRRIDLRVLTGAASAIDLSQVEGLALYTAYAAFAAMERDMNRQRTRAGLDARPENVRRKARPDQRQQATTARIGRRTAKPLRCAFNGTVRRQIGGDGTGE